MRITDEQARLLALCRVKGANWYLLAREAQRVGGLDRLWRGEVIESSPDAVKTAAAIKHAAAALDAHAASAEKDVEAALRIGAEVVTVVDQDYPANLRLIYNLPPFLFTRGEIRDGDLRSVAIVGTRQATEAGIQRAKRMACLLAEREVTVVSGLARGIDTAAHEGALESGGRTIAVIGTGILHCYPAENRPLADRIASSGAIVSQFWPSAPPTTYGFPRRNVTMSGMAQGTVVIEASSTSGAKMQARIALEHGKNAFLIRSLTQQQEWAMRYVRERGAIMVDDVEDVIRTLLPSEKIHAADDRRAQLALQFGQ